MNSQEGRSMDLARAAWRKPRRSQGNGECVEVVDDLPGVVPVRDSKNPHTALVLPEAAWTAFVMRLKD
ncbi:DUF397 domain-containing protein [Streptomyces hainanensis]|uniref:DUF397 domain-containing protein n=1 Tax=Streptomyces hainanensis TaxID=402648 RepID=A0A4R4SWL0_9ACTN|nr:DUF397 domain-containing protein [Streptomyces hainanensis]TDC67646.1 DUF397 domain-containing protein [Streptomyces hainanensis]